ncbi:MAG TPA: NAD(P)H-binding protein [Bryobacteraceae bacterium]|nr:NAD(P)H-binding protein [Bryobacteraceae bacterium]
MDVFISGGTGYMGGRLIPALLSRGHRVRALARPGSEKRLRAGCEVVSGNALDSTSFVERVRPADVFVHMVGVAHPGPAKAKQFREIDLPALRASVEAARTAGARRFVYVSVARPAPVMKAYQEVRAECEAMIEAAGLDANILRPWYVLGPGHRWPYALIPFYRLMQAIPATRERAIRLGLVSIDQMTEALVWAVENPASGMRIIDVPMIRALPTLSRTAAS